MAHAIVLCASDGLSLGAARTGEHVSRWKAIAAPAAAFQAIHNIRLAQFGITGPLHAFEGPMGLRQLPGKPFGIDWDCEGYDGVLACSIKRYNAEFHAQSSIEAIVEIRNSGRVRVDEIRRIEIGIFKAGYEMIGGGKYVNLKRRRRRKTRTTVCRIWRGRPFWMATYGRSSSRRKGFARTMCSN